jgi:hypothetical protein
MEFILTIVNAMVISFVELIYLFGVIIAVGFIIGFIERYIHTYLVLAFGKRGILFTAWIGTPVHELGHLLQCFIWGHRVTGVKLLQINDTSGVLGYVEHQYNRNSIYHQVGNFFIGVGPIISGIVSLIVGMYFLVPQSFQTFTSLIYQNATQQIVGLEETFGVVSTLVKGLFSQENLVNPLFWIYMLLGICISSHIALSKQDMKGSARGLIAIFVVLLLIKLVTGLLGFDSHILVLKLAQYNAYVLAYSTIGILFALIALLLSYTIYKVKQTLII